MEEVKYDHILIREASILVRVPEGIREIDKVVPEFFDVRTGVQLKQIYPELQSIELRRGYLLSKDHAAAIIKTGLPINPGPSMDASKVVGISEVKQRKLDNIVADSIFDQLKLITKILQEFQDVAVQANKEEKFWLSQQILTLVRKFSGRELEELEDIIEWFKTRQRK